MDKLYWIPVVSVYKMTRARPAMKAPSEECLFQFSGISNKYTAVEMEPA